MKRRDTHFNRVAGSCHNDSQPNQRDDIEMSFIRTLSVRGLVLSGPISPEDRRERIRIAIFSQKLDAAPFDANMTFAEAYKLCYSRPLELRRVDRDTGRRLVDEHVPYGEHSPLDDVDEETIGFGEL